MSDKLISQDQTVANKNDLPLHSSEEALLARWHDKQAIQSLLRLFPLQGSLGVSLKIERGSDEEKNALLRAAACEATGTTDLSAAMAFFHQYLRIAVPEESVGNAVEEGSAYFENMTALHPQDAMEGALLTQILSLQALGMKFMKYAANPNHSPQVVDRSVNNFTKLLRLQHETIETLNRYRRKGIQQVVVQHVNVTQGGQAIVGGVQEMGGGFRKNGGSTP